MKATQTGFIRLRFSIGVGAAAVLLAPLSMAQTAESNSDERLEEVVVTAQFREERLQDTPIAITAVTAEMIEQRSATNLADVANAAPSVVLRPASAAFGNSITASIRGFGQIDFNPAYEPGVGLYIDDVYYPRLTGANFDLLDVERVEVLRGPQGTLTGRNSEGGAIRFVTRKPTGDGGGVVSATFGSRDRINVRASTDFSLTEHLSGRISGTFADQNGYVDVLDYGCAVPSSGLPAPGGGTNCELYSLGDVGYRSLRTILRYNPSERFDLMISGDYTRDKRFNGAEVLLFGSNANPNVQTVNGLPYDSRFICGEWCNFVSTGQEAGSFTAGLIPPLQGLPMPATRGSALNTYEGWNVSANMEIGISDTLRLTSISAYREWQNQFSVDNDLSPARVGFGNNDLTHSFWSQELRLNAEFSDRVNATFGAYYSDEETKYYTLQDIRYVAAGPLPIFPLQFIGDDPVETQSQAVFATVNFSVTEALSLTAGVRYTEDSKDYTFFRYNLDGRTINPFLDGIGARYGAGYEGPDTLDANNNGNVTEVVTALTGRKASFKGDRTDYRVSVDYRFNPQILAYATVATGYKAGGVGPRPFNAAQARSFGPEEVTSYEVGFKTDLFDRRVRLNGAIFLNDFKEAQLTLLSCPQFGGPGPCALPQNAGDATVKGLELELMANPVEGLQLDAAISIIDWEWDCVNPAVVGLASGPCSSDPAVVGRLSSPPRGLIETKWNLGLQYRFDLGERGSLTPRIDVNYQDELAGGDLQPAANSPSALFGRVPDYTLANARLGWQNAEGDLDIALEITNLADEYYFLSKFDLTGAGAGAIAGAPGRPREWAVTVKKKF